MNDHREIDLLNVFRLLRQRFPLIMLIVGIATAVAIIMVKRIPNEYTAEATIVMNSRRTNISDLQSLLSTPLLGVPAADTSILRTEIEKISAPALVQRVVEEERLLEVPEFNPSLNEQNEQQLSLSARIEAIPAVHRALVSAYNMITEALTRIFGPAVADPRRPSALDPLALTVARVQKALSVTNDGVSYVLAIRFQARDPRLAAEVANAFANIYLREQENVKLSTTRAAETWLANSIQQLQTDLLASERGFLDVRAQYALEQENGSTLLDREIAQVNAQLTAASAERTKYEAELAEIQHLLKSPGAIDGISAVQSSPVVQTLRIDEARLQGSLAGLSTQLFYRHPDVQGDSAKLREIRGKIDAEIKTIVTGRASALDQARRNESSLKDRLAELKQRRVESTDAELKLRSLERVANANRALYVSYLEKYKEIQAQEHSQEPDARLLSLASAPLTPSYPQRTMLVGAATVASAGVATAFVLLLGWRKNGIYGVEGLEGIGPVRAFGLIPEMDRSATPLELVVNSPRSMYAEAVQSVHTTLQCLPAPDYDTNDSSRLIRGNAIYSGARVVVVTSSLPEEGKSVVAASLARSIALAGRKVLLLDCDLRRPAVARLFKRQADVQLSEFIRNPNALSELVTTDSATGLHYVAIRKEYHGVYAVLNSPQLALMLNEARLRYDYVVIDTPPLAPVSDALLISRLADLTLLVARWKRTPRAVVGHILRVLRENRVPLAGVVLTRVNMRKHARYNYWGPAYFRVKYGGRYA